MQIPARGSFVSFYRSIFWLRNVTSLTASRLDTIPSQSDPKSATKSYNLNSFVALFVKYICLLKSHRYPTDQTSHLSLSLLPNENWYFAMFEHHPWLWHVTCCSVFTPGCGGGDIIACLPRAALPWHHHPPLLQTRVRSVTSDDEMRSLIMWQIGHKSI